MSKEKEPQQTEDVVSEVEVDEEFQAQTDSETETARRQASEEAAEAQVDETAALREQLEAEQNKYLRLMADYDNFKRRAQKDKQDAEKFRAQSLLTDLLPVMDNFDRALAVEAKSEEAASILKGLEMVRNNLLEAVKREGLEEVKALGEPFDPNFHQAVMQEKDENAESGSVLMELQKGYTLKGRVLRPSMVKVNE
ncbi:nucleotide exchange factor GrpE [Planococcus shenhongbingii]|uniref:Protein GrpE n=1 Tax=Planococcus shenhongbingii TaxID=3058398 RepID=A0ABT8NDN1_9BACL|nr:MULTISPECIES: nucleotide exchange factor GrpE [unclassified Planococcus (in: firmicutes)]MDN7245809.1 nucleotide exchange factor GrpE [Planococcus sp. N017]WKA60077.1 nucleotide exchange factor GrpE [Planococcus sp. N016]